MVEERELELNLWELCISEKSAREKSLAYLDVDVIILCFDRYNLESLKRVTQNWHDEGKTVCFSGVPRMLVGIRDKCRMSVDVMNERCMNEKSILDIDIKIAVKSVKAREYSEHE